LKRSKIALAFSLLFLKWPLFWLISTLRKICFADFSIAYAFTGYLGSYSTFKLILNAARIVVPVAAALESIEALVTKTAALEKA
jgi:hypothetical protein